MTRTEPTPGTVRSGPTWPSGPRLEAGDHVCAFYRKESERDDILIPFLLDGLKAGDRCTCVVDSCAPSEVLDRLGASVDVDAYVADRQLEVMHSDETYFATGGFLPERMLKFWSTKASCDSGDRVYSFVRNIGDMSWAHRDRPGVDQLAHYESELNRVMSDQPQANLCLYDLTRCSAELVMDVLKTHPKAMLGSMVIDNPYYLDPDEFLAHRQGSQRP